MIGSKKKSKDSKTNNSLKEKLSKKKLHVAKNDDYRPLRHLRKSLFRKCKRDGLSIM